MLLAARALVLVWSWATSLAGLGFGAGGEEPCGASYECTVMVPQMVTEMRTVKVCQWRSEELEGTYTACRRVPERRTIEYEYTVPTYETRTREFIDFAFKPVVSTHQRDYTVMVPYTENRQGIRRVCRMVPVEVTRTVCEDRGSWQEAAAGACGCCGAGGPVCKVWVPKLEQREVACTVMRPHVEDVEFEYTVTCFRPEKRSETVEVCNYVQEQVKRVVPYTVCVPKKRIGTREVTTWHTVEEEKSYTYTVRVPHVVEQQVPVRVCRMVPKKVTCQAPPCCCRGCW